MSRLKALRRDLRRSATPAEQRLGRMLRRRRLGGRKFRRQQEIEAQGIRVLRFENREVLEAPDVVCAAIAYRFGDWAAP